MVRRAVADNGYGLEKLKDDISRPVREAATHALNKLND